MEEKYIYRSKFIISFVHIYLVFFILILVDDGLGIDYEALLFASVIVTILTFVVIRYFKITITDKYLNGYDFWGIYHSVDWGSIMDVKPIRIAGLRYFRIESTMSKRSLWIPFFLDNISGFKKESIKRLGENNPLKKYLEEQIN